MLYKAVEIDELINTKENDREIIDLMENNGSHLKIISLKKHEVIEPHTAHTNVCVYVIEGEIELIFNPEDNCTCEKCECNMPDEIDEEGKKYKIKKEQLFLFEKNIMHSVKALKDSVFLLIKI